MSSLELPGQQIAQPPLQQGNNSPEEKEPDSPHGLPKPTAGSFAHRSRVEPVVNHVFNVFAISDLSH
jgi:hypothetical protein